MIAIEGTDAVRVYRAHSDISQWLLPLSSLLAAGGFTGRPGSSRYLILYRILRFSSPSSADYGALENNVACNTCGKRH
jgi:hypothetical protein